MFVISVYRVLLLPGVRHGAFDESVLLAQTGPGTGLPPFCQILRQILL